MSTLETRREVEAKRAQRRAGSEGLVLVADDEPDARQVVRRWLERTGYEVEVFANGESCLAGLSRTLPDAVCLDLDMPGLGGLETLKRIQANNGLLPVIILTGDSAVESVVSAMRLGAYDYLVKPVDATKLVTTVRNAQERYRMSVRLTQLEREVRGMGQPGMVANSPVMKELFRTIDRLAASDVSALIQGESGTGKELAARAIHLGSGRRESPFVALNCAAIPEALQEAELFGHEKGAFTGATERRIGRFEEAHCGTLFLDEVAELSLTLQAKLLRVIEEQSFRRVGGTTDIQSDFRLVSATHRKLTEQIRAGTFREDLFFRIAVFELEIPPLRDRIEDVEILCDTFLAEYAENGSRPRLAEEVTAILKSYHWPGNVRELRNVIQRALVMATEDLITPEHLPQALVQGEPAPVTFAPKTVDGSAGAARDDLSLNLDDMEHRTIRRALRHTQGNLSEVGRLLGIGRTTLYRKLKKYQIDVDSR